MSSRETKINQRITLVTDAAEKTACNFRDSVLEKHGIKISLAPVSTEIELFVNAYFKQVDLFKEKHKFPPNNRINNAKIAGLMLYVLLRDGVPKLFNLKKHPKLPDLRVDVVLLFCWTLCCMILALKTDKLEEAEKRTDKNIRIFPRKSFDSALLSSDKSPPSQEFLCASMEWLREGFGDLSIFYSEDDY